MDCFKRQKIESESGRNNVIKFNEITDIKDNLEVSEALNRFKNSKLVSDEDQTCKVVKNLSAFDISVKQAIIDDYIMNKYKIPNDSMDKYFKEV